MEPRRPLVGPERQPAHWFAVALLLAGLLSAVLPQLAARQAAAEKATGWVCGMVVDEAFAFVDEAELALYPQAQPGAAEPEPLARISSDARGLFCLQDLAPGFYQLRVSKSPWPVQSPRTVEVRAGQVNRLTPIELELEPGDPRVSYQESFDGMPSGQARAVVERLLMQGDAESIRELARRLLPKRGPQQIDIGRLLLGFDPRPLTDELMRQLESGYLPPLKTARYVYVVGQLVDDRTRDAVIEMLLRKLRDGRRLPTSPSGAAAGGRTSYVSDIAIQALAGLAGKDFKWQYGEPPVQNQSAIRGAVTWWQQELDKRARDRRR